MPNLPRKIFLIFAGLVLLAACNLPQGGALTSQIVKGADSPESTFEVHPVTRETLPQLSEWPQNGHGNVSGWISRSRGPAQQIIEAGDTINLAIWDNEESSLLMQPQQKVVALNGMTVSAKGTVFLPYLDEVYIAKMSPDKARATIQEKFVSLIPSAQVQLSLVSGRQSSVDLVSGVGKPGNFVMPDRDFTILGLIAMGGGVAPTLANPQIRLSRGGKLYGVSMDKLLANPSLDTTLRGGDKVYVENDERYFLSLGAAGKEAQIPFPTDRVTALDAVSLIGGLNEQRANPKGVLVLRDYSPKALRTDGTGPAKERVVFAIDLASADGLFSAGEFSIQDKDLVLVTESPVTAANTVIEILFGALGVGVRANSFR
ncbi:MAG: polysaccharide biosynthesis/export family protein [Paracoccaceae bacterium]